MAEFAIKGLDPILAKMKNLSQKLQTKGVRTAGTKAMRIVRDAARAGAARLDDAKSPANIAKAIVTRNDAKGGKRVGGVVIKVGVVGGARPLKGNKDPGHWRYLEFGASNTPAQPFMRKALEKNVEKVRDSFVSNLNSEIDKAITKGGG